MMKQFMMFLPGDRVKYTGNKLHSQLSTKIGEVVGVVLNDNRKFIVDFGDDAYIINVNNLSRVKRTDDSTTEVMHSRKRFNLDE